MTNKRSGFLLSLMVLTCFSFPALAYTYEDYPQVRLRSLDKITARTMTFDARVGSTVRFGDIYIKVQSCRKPPPVEAAESAAFLQIWQVDPLDKESKWIFSGWMFGSSPSLSSMDHPIYDVWLLDCIGKNPEPEPPPEEAVNDEAAPTDGEVSGEEAQPPTTTPDKPENKTEDPDAQPAAAQDEVAPATDNAEPVADAEPAPDNEVVDETPADDSAAVTDDTGTTNVETAPVEAAPQTENEQNPDMGEIY